jgi:hypothetical protein
MLLGILVATSFATTPLAQSVFEAIQDEIQYGIESTAEQDIDRYMETVPADYRLVEGDGSITDRAAVRSQQLQAWAIIPKTNSIDEKINGFRLGCDGECATVWTHQKWDRQMLGRDGKSVHNVVTTQRHQEQWEQRDGRWVAVSIKELGGTVTVDGKPYD